jgi:hypothetical protein
MSKVIANEKVEFTAGMKRFDSSGQLDAIITMNSEVEENVPTGERYIHIYLHIHIHICTYTHTYIYVHIHTHIQTHTHTHTHASYLR